MKYRKLFVDSFWKGVRLQLDAGPSRLFWFFVIYFAPASLQ